MTDLGQRSILVELPNRRVESKRLQLRKEMRAGEAFQGRLLTADG